jgi:hypothetical protein
MDGVKGKFQVVEVTGECCLRDGGGTEHAYWRRDGCSLAPGFYVVHWPPGGTVGRFHEDARFEGPFTSRGGAEAGLPRIAALVAGDNASEPGPEQQVPVVDDRVTMRRRPT